MPLAPGVRCDDPYSIGRPEEGCPVLVRNCVRKVWIQNLWRQDPASPPNLHKPVQTKHKLQLAQITGYRSCRLQQSRQATCLRMSLAAVAPCAYKMSIIMMDFSVLVFVSTAACQECRCAVERLCKQRLDHVMTCPYRWKLSATLSLSQVSVSLHKRSTGLDKHHRARSWHAAPFS